MSWFKEVFMLLSNRILPRKEITQLGVYQPGKPIEEVQREFGLKKVIKLASNENPFGCSPIASAALQGELKNMNLYPESTAPLLAQKIADKLMISMDSILVGNGSDELIHLLARAYVRDGDEVIMADVTFPRYETNVLIEGGNPVKVPLIDGVHDLDGMFQAITEKTRMIFVCNPNNPTGTIVDKLKLQSFIDRVPEHILLVIDEAYYEYVITDQFLQTLPLLNTHPNLIIFRTFSKIYGLAALRIGYGVMHPALAAELLKVKDAFNTNRLAQIAAIASIDDDDFVAFCVEKNEEGRIYLQNELTRLGIPYYPSHGNFIMVNLSWPGNNVFESLLKQGIIVRPCGYPNSIRVTIGSEEENAAFIQALEKTIMNGEFNTINESASNKQNL
jgi:histidinol-phosphate aminotransferase